MSGGLQAGRSTAITLHTAAISPDASVMPGISAVMDVFEAAKAKGTDVVVHACGGAAAVMASYHAAYAAARKAGRMSDAELSARRRDDRRPGTH
ncbi:hypothetical protein NKH84_14115 [Mesorhizobium sp. M0902]|uniref:hypothetical protein n=1 Tax=Mesorhizobium sp. M0902 TaxID=2957021 RepID=UPI003336481A